MVMYTLPGLILVFPCAMRIRLIKLMPGLK